MILIIIDNPCYNNPCLNGATCQVSGSGLNFLCICPTFYSGTYCQTCNYTFQLKIIFNYKKKLI